MKTKSLLLIVVIMLGFTRFSYGSFPVKHITVANSGVAKSNESANTLTNKIHSVKTNWLAKHSQNVFHPLTKYLFPERRRSDTNGLLSFIFGIVGLALAPSGILLGIPAIVLGIVGMKRNEKFSVTGLVLGIIGFLYSLLYVFLLLALFGSGGALFGGFLGGVI